MFILFLLFFIIKKTIKSVERSKTELNQAKSRITCLEDELHDITKKFEVDKENLNDEISQLKEINNEMNLKICVFLEQLSEYKNHVEKLKLELQYSRYKISLFQLFGYSMSPNRIIKKRLKFAY